MHRKEHLVTSKHTRVLVVPLALALVLGGCAASGGTSGSAAPTSVALATLAATVAPAASPAPVATAAPSAGVVAGASATPGPIDPCTLLTSDEASTLIGTKLGAGVSSTVDPDRVCTFKAASGLTEVKLFLTPPAPDSATAQAYWDFARSQTPFEIPITDLTLFDRSAYGSGTSAGVSVSALFAVKGQYGFDLFCGFPDCSKAASITAAQLIGDRLP